MSPRLVRSLSLLALVLALSACGDAFHRPAAVVDGVAITDGTVAATMPVARVLTALLRTSCGTQGPGEPARGPCLRYTLGYLIQRQVARAYAGTHDLSVASSDVQAAIAQGRRQCGTDQVNTILGQFGVDEPQFEGLVRQQLLLGEVRNAVAADAVGDRQLREAYDRQKTDFTLLHVAHIQLGSQQEAEQVARRVTPENFAELAKKLSTDQGSAAKGGDLGTVPAGRLPADFVAQALTLQPGEVSGAVESVGTWHIIKMISVRVQPFEQVRDQLVAQLAGPAFQQWLEGRLREGVEVNPRYGRLDPGTGEVVRLSSTATALPSPTASGP